MSLSLKFGWILLSLSKVIELLILLGVSLRVAGWVGGCKLEYSDRSSFAWADQLTPLVWGVWYTTYCYRYKYLITCQKLGGFNGFFKRYHPFCVGLLYLPKELYWGWYSYLPPQVWGVWYTKYCYTYKYLITLIHAKNWEASMDCLKDINIFV